MSESRVEDEIAAAGAGAPRYRLIAFAAVAALMLAALALWARYGSTLFGDMLALVTSCF